MIIFDTNLISEIVRPVCNPAVQLWMRTCDANSISTTAVNLAELRAGIEYLPQGKRKETLRQSTDQLLEALFQKRFLSFDAECANRFGELLSRMRRLGRAIGTADAQIAAIAMVHDYQIATRDVQPFLDAGLTVVNPWDQVLK
jgi:toxin FitB